jgi:hypothetical protein
MVILAELGIDWVAVNSFLGALTLVLLSIKSAIDYWITNKQNTKLSDIHSLVNSAMGTQLEINAASTERTAEATGDKGDAKIAQLAKTAVDKHKETQDVIDEKK